MGQPTRGSSDYFEPGDWNVACSMCGRKDKASKMVKNWQGLYRHPWHNEPRQPQDFARGVKDVMTVPYAQPETDVFVPVHYTFPSFVTPTNLLLTQTTVDLTTEGGDSLLTEGGDHIVLEVDEFGTATASTISWITAVSYAWSWQSGGVGITILNPTLATTGFFTTTPGLTGVAQCLITSSLGSTSIATVTVSS